MSTGRKKGPKAMPELAPQTVAMLTGHFRVHDGGRIETGKPSAREKRFSLAAFPAKVEPRLARLIYDVRVTRRLAEDEPDKESRRAYREMAARHEEKLGRVSTVAAAIGDRAFFQQVDECLAAIEKHLSKRREALDYPLRVLILRVCKSKALDCCTVSEMKHHLAGMTAATFTDDEIRNDLRALGVLERRP